MKTDQTGYASVPGLAYENQGWVTEVEGEIPNEMEGTLLRNGPAMYEREGFIKSYLDGDGMVNFREFADYICAHKYEEFVRKHSRSLSVTGLVHEGIHTTTTKGGGRKRMLELMETRKYSRKLLDKIDTRTKALVVDRLFSLCERRQPPSEQQDEAGGAGSAAAQGTSPLAHVHG